MHYKFALAGATGQIGRYLEEALEPYGKIYRIGRYFQLNDIPPVEHVINAAGYTKFDENFERYFRDNIRLAVALAAVAENYGAHYHQLSSEAVAEFREHELDELKWGPYAHPSMNHYAISKVMVEHAVLAAVSASRLHIYRCSDVVPARGTFDEAWRSNHWLSIMFAYGRNGFTPPDDFPVWIATTQDMAEAIALLINHEGSGAYHLLGHIYHWRQFWEAATEPNRNKYRPMLEQVRPVIRIEPPLATRIDQIGTLSVLRKLGFKWEYLGPEYWREYSDYARRNDSRAASTADLVG